MRRLVCTTAFVMCLGLVAVVATNDVAAELRPCCEGGRQVNKPCQNDNQCKGICVGGYRDGLPCEQDEKCGAACLGGTRDGSQCTVDADCPGGSCGQPGFCEQGTCTALCQKGKPPKTPSEPVSEWLGLDEAAGTVTLLRTCP